MPGIIHEVKPPQYIWPLQEPYALRNQLMVVSYCIKVVRADEMLSPGISRHMNNMIDQKVSMDTYLTMSRLYQLCGLIYYCFVLTPITPCLCNP